MALVTTDFLAAFLTGLRAIFNEELDAQDPLGVYKRISSEMPSSSDKESYSWLGAVPAMTEWKAGRRLYGLGEYDYTLTNKHYEATVEIDRDTIEDDKYQLIRPRVASLVRRALRHFDEKVFSQLDDGGTLKAYDGTAMFADTRTIGDSGNIDNKLSGAYSGSTAEVLAAMNAAIQAMRGFKDDRGVPLNLTPDTIVCAPAMEMLIKEALLPGVAGTVRPQAGIFGAESIISTPWVDADTLDWYVLCTKAEVKPVIFQLRKKPEFSALDDPKGEHVFKNRTFLYGVDTRFEVGYGDPRTAVKIVDA